ncbi:MAG: amidohydrolase family protein [Acidobacteriota bacterium]|nr:amidohydrolase family protein [Acidobacteriota bacterium]
MTFSAVLKNLGGPPDNPARCHLVIRNGILEAVLTASHHVPDDLPHLDLNDHIVFPGLINSHDHLAFNLYPALRESIYADYVTWGPAIHRSFADLIREIEAIPRPLRTRWGAVRNLVNGFTTVMDHEAEQTPDPPYPTRITDFCYLHSMRFHKRPWLQILKPPFRLPLVAHLGEGTTRAMYRETRRLLRFSRLRRIVAVHGIALTSELADRLAGLVWCPDSNLFLYGKTAAADRLKQHCPVMFGTDSSLSADPDPWRQLRKARDLGMLTDRELYDALTTVPARIWNLPHEGALQPGAPADLVVARRGAEDAWDAFFGLGQAAIRLVLCAGNPVLVDPDLPLESSTLIPSRVGEETKLTPWDLQALREETLAFSKRVQFPLPIGPPET